MPMTDRARREDFVAGTPVIDSERGTLPAESWRSGCVAPSVPRDIRREAFLMTVPVASAVPKVPVVSVIEARFARLLAGIVGLDEAVRLLYVLTDHRPLIGGDGLAYRLDALRIADGQG